MNIKFIENEYWYGGMVDKGFKLPIGPEDDICLRLTDDTQLLDQSSPLFISNKGRYIYGERAFDVHFSKGEIIIDTDVKVEYADGYKTLKGAHLAVANKYFSLCGKSPDLRFFETPQYNTWIELMYNQNQKDILNYARSLKDGDMPSGVFMIDEGWAPDYGTYEFDVAKFTDPKKMVNELHEMGFSVMLWITPIISPDSNCYRELRDTDLIIKNKDGKPAIREWWNGYSCVLDFSNPKTREWFGDKLKYLMDTYGVDGFKFDSGDTYLYRADDKTYITQEPAAHTKTFDTFCGEYAFNELRCVWNCGGAPLVCRLQDKKPAWDETGLATLIPNILTQGILGYYYGCPDMVGGGAYGSFLESGYKTDEELYLRWLGASILCPMIQFSISPKRILSEQGFKTVQTFLALREEFTPTIIKLVKNASETGEPVVRYMEYEFPDYGYEKITDQFMLGSEILVAPVFEKGTSGRKVHIPIGIWQDACGNKFTGPSAEYIDADIDELIVLRKCK